MVPLLFGFRPSVWQMHYCYLSFVRTFCTFFLENPTHLTRGLRCSSSWCIDLHRLLMVLAQQLLQWHIPCSFFHFWFCYHSILLSWRGSFKNGSSLAYFQSVHFFFRGVRGEGGLCIFMLLGQVFEIQASLSFCSFVCLLFSNQVQFLPTSYFSFFQAKDKL